jgi:hypothetical protein
MTVDVVSDLIFTTNRQRVERRGEKLVGTGAGCAGGFRRAVRGWQPVGCRGWDGIRSGEQSSTGVWVFKRDSAGSGRIRAAPLTGTFSGTLETLSSMLYPLSASGTTPAVGSYEVR